VARTVYPTTPPAVEYRLTALGKSLQEALSALAAWSASHHGAIHAARRIYDAENMR
jgi:DNA-binding HxlR family transcriptional regulator